MFCPKCGTPGKGKSFCTRCGLQLTLVRYQGVPVTKRILSDNHNAPTVRVEPNLATQKFAAPTMPNALARVTAVATLRLRPAMVTRAKKPRRIAPIFVGALLLLVVTASGFWWRKSQGQIVQAQVLAPTQSQPSDGNTAVQIKEHNSTTDAVQPEPAPARNYEWAVIEDQTRGVSGAAEALLADEKMAAVEPGGQLALDFRAGQFFGNGPQADLQIFGMPQESVSYTLFVRNDPTAAWQRVDINYKSFAAGVAKLDIGQRGVRQAKQILIRNDAQSELHIDAVSALYRDVASAAVSRQAKPAHSGRKVSIAQSPVRKRTIAFSDVRWAERPTAFCPNARHRGGYSLPNFESKSALKKSLRAAEFSR